MPHQVVRRVTREQGVTAEQMLCYILGTLQKEAILKSVTNDGAGLESLFAIIDSHTHRELIVDSQNVADATARGIDPSAPQLKSLFTVVKTGHAVRAVLKQLINESENFGLRTTVRFEEMLMEFVGGSIDGETRLLVNEPPKIGEEAEIGEHEDTQFVEIYQLRDDGKCHFRRCEYRPPPVK